LITGVEKIKEIELINFLEKNEVPYWIRFVYAKNITDDKENIENIKRLLKTLKFNKRFDILPLHLLAKSKYENLGLKWTLKDENVPSKKDVEELKKEIESI
jgi:pyruvate formate lyase activating enzyme